MSNLMRWVLITSLAVAMAACTETQSPMPPDPEGAVVTFRVADAEEFKVRLTDPADIEIARKLLAGEDAPSVPNGVVVRGDPDVNTGYTWHIDPETFEFADATIELCDGLPSHVEQGSITSDRYCPWSAQVIAIQP